MNTEHLKELVALVKRKDELEAQLTEVDRRAAELKAMLIPQFLTAGCQNMRIDGRLVSLVQDVYASPAEEGGGRGGVIRAMREADLASFVEENYNTNTLKAYVREIGREIKEACMREGRLFDEAALRGGLPEPLRRALKVSFVHTLRVLKG